MSDQPKFNVVMSHLANPDVKIPTLTRPKHGINRSDIVNTLQECFTMIGGVKRMALWANECPGDFFKLYAKMLPSSNIQIGDNAQIQIIHSIPPTALDNHNGQVVDVVVLTPEDARADNP